MRDQSLDRAVVYVELDGEDITEHVKSVKLVMGGVAPRGGAILTTELRPDRVTPLAPISKYNS